MAQNSQIRVLIVDRTVASRKNICKLLLPQPDIEVVGIARDGHEGIRIAQVLEPQTILLDPDLSFSDSLQTIKTLAASMPTTRIILITASSDTQYLRDAMLAGVRTFLAQPPKASDLLDALRRDNSK